MLDDADGCGKGITDGADKWFYQRYTLFRIDDDKACCLALMMAQCRWLISAVLIE